MGLQEANTLLQAINRFQAGFLDDADPDDIFAGLLNDVLALSASEAGVVGEVASTPDGRPRLEMRAVANLSSGAPLPGRIVQAQQALCDLDSLDPLIQQVLTSAEIVSATHPDSASGSLAGVGALSCMPVMSDNTMVGMIGLAKGRGVYAAALVDYLRPLLDSCGRIITRMRAERRRDDAQARLDATVATAVDAIVVIDAKGLIRSCNPAVERMFGYRADELIGKNVNQLMPEPYRSRHDSHLTRYLSGGTGAIIGIGREVEGQRADGDVFPMRLAVSEFTHGDETLFTGIASDLSAFKEVEGASRRFQLTLDQVHDGVFIFDPDSLLFTYVNAAATGQVGYSCEELYGMTLLDINPFFTENILQEVMAPLRYGERQSLTFSTVHKRADGAHVPVEILLQYVVPEYEAPRFVAVVRDISDRVEAENALRESDERLRLSQSFANVGTWDWNIKTGDLFWSERIGPLFGYEEGELETTYENFLSAVHPDDRQAVIDAVNACIDTGAEYSIEHRCVWPNGQVHWMLERGDVIRDKNGEPLRMLGVVQDITQLKQVQTDLLAAKDEAERANRAKSDFLSSMSHELRTPLNAIMGFAQLFNYDISASEQQRQVAREIYQAGKHLRILVDDILDLAKIEAGQFQVSLEPLAIPPLVEECRKLVLPLADKHGVRLDLRPEHCRDLAVLADQTRLKQVILNLLSNAIKYNYREGAVTLSCSRHDEDYVRISVRDTGVGIAPQDIKHLFKPFSRLVSDQSYIEGSGIGLSITKQFVELMQGDIGVESEPGKGSTFWVDLALARPTEQSAGVAENAAGAAQVAAYGTCNVTGVRILVVEDNPTNRTVFQHQLQALGYSPEIVGSPREVPARLKNSPYDLILTDIHMPEMDGYELVQYIRAREQETSTYTPVIAVTANALPGERDRCLKAGMDDYIPKPVDMEVLRHTLCYWLGGREPPPASDQDLAYAATGNAEGSVNLARLAALVGGELRQQRAIINNFVETLPETLAAIHAAFHKPDAGALYFWAHRFKSSAAAVGAESLAQMCQTLEDFAEEQEWDGIASLVGELDSQVQRVVKDLKAALMDFDLRRGPQTAYAADALDIGLALVVDDDPVILCALEAALRGVGVAEVLTAKSAADALRLMDKHQPDIEVVLCDLNMPVMDGVEYLRHLVARNYRGAIVLLSGEDSRILASARNLADAHSFQFVAAIPKPVAQARLAEVLSGIQPRQQRAARRAQSEISLDELQGAITRDEFVVYYQPKIDAFSRRLVGVESLVRWQHPQKGFIMPDRFIPLAEDNGLIDELTDLVLDKAFAQLKQWRARGMAMSVSINIAVGTIGRRLDFPERVMSCLERYELAPQDVILELTEGGLMKDIAATLDALVRLRLKGITLSIDDFGTGYSSFKQLQGIPFSELKIDKEFVMNASGDAASRAILESSVLLGQKLGMTLVAEGVESETDWALLRELGCHMVQGFYIARPMPGEQLEAWHAEWSAQPGPGAS